MDWNAISGTAEVVAAIGVIASLLYLARQIRAQTRESRLAATRELARDWQVFMIDVMRDAELFKLYQRAIRDYSSLEDGDRIKAFAIFTGGMRMVELQFLHVSDAHFDTRFFAGIQARLQEMGSFPGVQQYWALNAKQFDPKFVEFAERVSSIAGGGQESAD